MLYPLVRPFATIAIWAFYRKIYLSNAHRIPNEGPVILAANHPTAFMEPCILACFQDRPLHFLVRGDLFKKNIFASLLGALNMLPVYRLQDGGYKSLKINFSTFEDCFKALKDGKAIMILAEGGTIQEKRLRPIRKGTARIAFGTLDKYGEMDLPIIPVGVNYTYADQPRSEVMINFGEPILIKEYLEEYQKNPNKAISRFTNDLRKGLQENVITIEKKEDEELVEQLFILMRNAQPEPIFPVISKMGTRLQMEKSLANLINQLKESSKTSLKENADSYFEQLKLFKLNDRVVSQTHPFNWRGNLGIILGFFLFVPGFILNYWPTWLARFIADAQVKEIEFRASVRLTINIVGYLLYFILLLFLSWYFHSWCLFGLTLIMPFLGYFALLYLEFFNWWKMGRRFSKLKKEEVNHLKQLREEVIKMLKVHQV